MLPPVSAASTFVDYPSAGAQQADRSTAGNAEISNDQWLVATPLSRGRLDAMSLSGQLQLAQGISVFSETIGKLIDLPRQENESLASYAKRITDAVQAMDPTERAALERMLSQLVKGIPLRLLAGILQDPTGPEALRLSAQLETAEPSHQDAAAKAAVSSYRQTDGLQAAAAAMRDIPQNAAAIPPARGVGDAAFYQGTPETEQLNADDEASTSAAKTPAARAANIPVGPSTAASAPLPTSVSPVAIPREEISDKAFATTGAADRNADAAMARPPAGQPASVTAAPVSQVKAAETATAMPTNAPVVPAATEQIAEADLPMVTASRRDSSMALDVALVARSMAAFSAEAMAAFSITDETDGALFRSLVADGWADIDSPATEAGHSADIAHGSPAGPSVTAAAGQVVPVAAVSVTPVMAEPAKASIPQLVTAEGPAAALDQVPQDAVGSKAETRASTRNAILVMTEWLITAFGGASPPDAVVEALPLLSSAQLPVTSEAAETPAAPETTASISPKIDVAHVPNRPAADATASVASYNISTAEPRVAAPGVHVQRPGGEAADMRNQMQAALPLILPRDGMPLPYVNYPPTEQEPKREDRRVREIAPVDEDGEEQQQSAGQHASHGGKREHETQEEPAEADQASNENAEEADRANNLYWRMAGWS